MQTNTIKSASDDPLDHNDSPREEDLYIYKLKAKHLKKELAKQMA